jgi:hypothetical protein
MGKSVSEVAPSVLATTFQQWGKERRREIRENIFSPNERLITYTIRDDYILKHQENLKKSENNVSRE